MQINKILKCCLAVGIVLAVAACKEKKTNDYIIVKKPDVVETSKPSNQPRAMGNSTNTSRVNFAGDKLTIVCTLSADSALALATDGVSKYYDNRAVVRIVRSDGTTFFDRTFTKADFKDNIPDSYYKGGALVAVIFDKVEDGSLKFAVTVGSPDKESDDYMPLELSISANGAVTTSKATLTDQE